MKNSGLLHRISLSLVAALAPSGCVGEVTNKFAQEDELTDEASQEIKGVTTVATAYPVAVLLNMVKYVASAFCIVFWVAACGMNPSSSSSPTWDEFKAAATKEFDGHLIYVIHGDTAVSLEELRAEYERVGADWHGKNQDSEGVGVSSQASTVNRVNGKDDLWTAVQAANLTYCVSSEFGAKHSRAVSELSQATLDLEAWGNFNFHYVAAQDGNCNNANAAITFAVRPWNDGGACAFFPSGGGCVPRTVVIDFDDLDTNPGYGAVTSVGVFRHELGHVLGLRHEHIRASNTWCAEGASWRAVTGYDSASVMHYPWCPGATNAGDLVITTLDGEAISSLYPFQYQASQSQLGVWGHVDLSYLVDINNDGFADWVTKSASPNDGRIWWNLGTGNSVGDAFGSMQTQAGVWGHVDLSYLVDINNDGFADWVTKSANPSDGRIWWNLSRY